MVAEAPPSTGLFGRAERAPGAVPPRVLRGTERKSISTRLRCKSERPSTGRGRAQSGRLIDGFGGTALEKLRRKMLKALINAPLSSRSKKPLELIWISPFPTVIWFCVCLRHTATQFVRHSARSLGD